MKKRKAKILVVHGPNLKSLGKRETSIYGKFTLGELNRELKKIAQDRKVYLETFQSNWEGKIVDKIASLEYDFLIINPAAYTHSSVAIRGAILARNVLTIEVHISNIFKREEFRKKSLISDVVLGTITGLGKLSYLLALEAAINILSE